jgi:hypothetical protein
MRFIVPLILFVLSGVQAFADREYPVRAAHAMYGLHAFRRGLATNLRDLGIHDIVIQAILRHSNVSVIRASYIKNNGVDPQSPAAMEALESAVCNQPATGATEAESRIDAEP